MANITVDQRKAFAEFVQRLRSQYSSITSEDYSATSQRKQQFINAFAAKLGRDDLKAETEKSEALLRKAKAKLDELESQANTAWYETESARRAEERKGELLFESYVPAILSAEDCDAARKSLDLLVKFVENSA